MLCAWYVVTDKFQSQNKPEMCKEQLYCPDRWYLEPRGGSRWAILRVGCFAEYGSDCGYRPREDIRWYGRLRFVRCRRFGPVSTVNTPKSFLACRLETNLLFRATVSTMLKTPAIPITTTTPYQKYLAYWLPVT
jgi:hypothetical protein